MDEGKRSAALAQCARKIAEAYGRSLDLDQECDLIILRDEMKRHGLAWETATMYRLDDMVDGLLTTVWDAYDESQQMAKPAEPDNAVTMDDALALLGVLTSFPGFPPPPGGSISVGVPIGQSGFPEGEPVIVVSPPHIDSEEESEEAAGRDLYPADSEGQE